MSEPMKVHVLSGGTLRMKKSVYLADAAPGEMIDLPVPCFLIRHAQGNVLFDTGCHPQLAVDPVGRIGGMAKTMQLVSDPADNVLDGLRELGVAPGDIDLVVNSHFHTDHCGCNAFFTAATVLCHRCELEAAREQDAYRKGYFSQDWECGLPLQAVDAQYDVFGDGRIVLLPLIGHTPGSIGALLGLDRSGAILLAGDAASLQRNLDDDSIPRNTWDHDKFAQSLDEIRRIRQAGAQIFFGHDAGQWAGFETQRTFF